MKLGVFSMSLSVKDIYESKRFYEELGFNVFAGDMDSKYLVMKNGNTLIGLFQDLFEENILTFNPGWDANAKPLTDFDDIRHIQEQLKSKNIALEKEVDAAKGPASMIIRDPDGNMILIDQHV
jgi:catechol 2,3-dioxygenase-like lactoylglutathione lyase family enzyme